MPSTKVAVAFEVGATHAYCTGSEHGAGLYVYHVLGRTKHFATMAVPLGIAREPGAAMAKVRDLKANPGNPMYGTIKRMRVRVNHAGAEYVSVGDGSHATFYPATHGRVDRQPGLVVRCEPNWKDIDALERYRNKVANKKTAPPTPAPLPIRKRDEVVLLERSRLSGRAIVLGIDEDDLILKMVATSDIKIVARAHCVRAEEHASAEPESEPEEPLQCYSSTSPSYSPTSPSHAPF